MSQDVLCTACAKQVTAGGQSCPRHCPWCPHSMKNSISAKQVFFILSTPHVMGFPGGSDGKASACNAGDLGTIPGSGRSPGKGKGNPLQILAWKIPWTEVRGQATVHGVAKSRTRLSDFIHSLI